MGLLPRPSLKSQPFTRSKSLFHFSVQIDTSHYHNHINLLILVFPTQAVFYEPYRCHGVTMHSETHGYKAISKKTECCHRVSRRIAIYVQCHSSTYYHYPKLCCFLQEPETYVCLLSPPSLKAGQQGE